ncbi:MAG TPA: hypothetical protein VNW92_03910 [Polyangiaceae bacterium]|nr:hypothetical protein [Polyangiaceae bacterium]
MHVADGSAVPGIAIAESMQVFGTVTDPPPQTMVDGGMHALSPPVPLVPDPP